MIVHFDNLADVFSYEPKCPQCKKALKKYFATGPYEDLINFGHKTKLMDSKISKKEVAVTRKFTIADKELGDTEVAIRYKINPQDNSMKVDFSPSADDLVEKFAVAKGFYELEAARYELAQNEGLIHIWSIVKRAKDTLFAIQECEQHFKRVTVVAFDEEGEKIEEMVSFDEFLYTPTLKVEDQFYVVHSHTSPKKKQRSISIHMSEKDMIDNLDPQKGFVYLQEGKDDSLMKLDPSDPAKFARRLSTLFALKG